MSNTDKQGLLQGEGFRVLEDKKHSEMWVLSQHRVPLTGVDAPSANNVATMLTDLLNMDMDQLSSFASSKLGLQDSSDLADMRVIEVLRMLVNRAGDDGVFAFYDGEKDFSTNPGIFAASLLPETKERGRAVVDVDKNEVHIPGNTRVIFIEDTKELNLPENSVGVEYLTEDFKKVPQGVQDRLLEAAIDVSKIEAMKAELLSLTPTTGRLVPSEFDGLSVSKVVAALREVPTFVQLTPDQLKEREKERAAASTFHVPESNNENDQDDESGIPRRVRNALHGWAYASKIAAEHQKAVEAFLDSLGEVYADDDGVRDIIVDYIENTSFDADTAIVRLSNRLQEISDESQHKRERQKRGFE